MTALSTIEHGAVAAALACEVLTFRLGAEEYGIDILAVQEIRRFEAPMRIAGSCRHLLGVMNLRGLILPIMDMRRRLDLPDDKGAQTVTIIVHIGGRTFGLVVDSVSEVAALNAAQIQPPPPTGNTLGADFVVGLAQVDAGPLLQLLDLKLLLCDL